MTASPIVLDNGTGTVRCGCAGVSPLPLLRCPTVVGRATGNTVGLCERQNMRPCRGSPHHAEVLCGDDLAAARAVGGVELTYPMRNGIIQNMDAMEGIWDYALCERLPTLMRSLCQGKAGWRYEDGLAWLLDRPLLLCEQPNLSLRQRCHLFELFFEKYSLPAIQSVHQGLLSLFTNGAQCGVVVESGEGLSHCTPIYDGFLLATAQRSTAMAGRVVTDRLGQLIRQQQTSPPYRSSMQQRSDLAPLSSSLCFTDDMDILREMKERYCYVASDKACLGNQVAGETSAAHCECVLPDGITCRLGPERLAAPEVIFDPREVDNDSDGMAMTLWKSIEAAGIDLRASLCENIFLSGGTTRLPGFAARLEREMKSLYLAEKLKGNAARMAGCPVRVKEPQWRQHGTYMGGAILAEFSHHQSERWVSRSAYEDGGTSAIIARHHTG